MTGFAPTIGDPRPGYGLRVRVTNVWAGGLVAGDYSCPCGLAEDATGLSDVTALVIRYGRHRRDECPLPEVRQAGAREYAALQHSLTKPRRK